MPRPTRKNVEIFNFSFLDILACTIGALTFILVLVVVTNLNETTSDVDVREILEQVAQMEARLTTAKQRRQELSEQIERLEEEKARYDRQIEEARKQIDEARELERQSREQLQLARRQADDARGEIARLRPQNQALAKRVEELERQQSALAADVSAVRATVEQISAQFAQLERGVVNQQELVEQQQKLESDNRRLAAQVGPLEQAAQRAAADAERVEAQAGEALEQRAKLVALLEPLRERRDRLNAQFEAVNEQINQREAADAAAIGDNRNRWLATMAASVLLSFVILLLLWRLWLLRQIVRPMQQLDAELKKVLRKRRELEKQARTIADSAEAGPQSVEEALEQEQARARDAAERERAARQEIKRTQQLIADARRQVQSEQSEARELKSSAEQEKAESLRNATKIEFRVPLLRATTKSPQTFECYRQRVARLTAGEGLDESYYQIDTAKSAALSTALGKMIVAIDRKAEGEAVSDLDRGHSKLAGQIDSISGSRQFMFALVRQSGYETFRRLRSEAWKRNLEVGWQPMEEEMPILSGAGGGSGPGVQ